MLQFGATTHHRHTVTKRISRLSTFALLTVASLTPFLFFALFPRAFPYDIDTFLQWTECLKTYTSQPIKPCLPDTINYPTVGLYTSAGALWVLERLGSPPQSIRFHFKLFLAAIDILNVIVMYLLLRSLRIRFAAPATLLFAVLPSTRVGASVWGQIDTVLQLFLSLAFLYGLRALQATERGDYNKALRYFTGLTMATILACFTKQLVVFSLPGIAALWGLLASKLLPSPVHRRAIVVILTAIPLAYFIDRLFPTPPGYLGSGLLYILSTGSDHSSVLSASGSNLFSLLPVDEASSSKASYSLFTISGHEIAGTPFFLGIISAGLSLICGALIAVRVAASIHPPSARTSILCILGFTAFCNLTLNVFLTGIHERYLYHYGFFIYPVVLALLTTNRRYWILLFAVIAHLVTYGLFVLISFEIPLINSVAPVIHRGTVFGNLCLLLLFLTVSLWTTRKEKKARQSYF